MITVVDTAEAVQRAVDAVSDLVANGLIITSEVEIVKYAHRSVTAATDVSVSPG